MFYLVWWPDMEIHRHVCVWLYSFVWRKCCQKLLTIWLIPRHRLQPMLLCWGSNIFYHISIHLCLKKKHTLKPGALHMSQSDPEDNPHNQTCRLGCVPRGNMGIGSGTPESSIVKVWSLRTLLWRCGRFPRRHLWGQQWLGFWVAIPSAPPQMAITFDCSPFLRLQRRLIQRQGKVHICSALQKFRVLRDVNFSCFFTSIFSAPGRKKLYQQRNLDLQNNTCRNVGTDSQAFCFCSF